MLRALFTALLWLYPRQFRQNFAGEMQAVFGEALRCARREGLWAMLRLCGREARQLPCAVAREFWQLATRLDKNDGGMAYSMMANHKKPGWTFYPGWVVFSVISIPTAMGITLPLVFLIKNFVGDTIEVGGITRITEDSLIAPILIPVFGLLTGVWQLLLLHPYLPRMRWWIAATLSGGILSLVGMNLLFRIMSNSADTIWFGILGSMLFGGCIGLVQWLLLRQWVRRAAWWILANVLGWGVVSWGAKILPPQIIPAFGVLLIPGIATGFAIWLLLDQLPRRDNRGKDLTPSEVRFL